MKYLDFFSGNKQHLKFKGIYKISFNQDLYYVGSTTVSFSKRFGKHLSEFNSKTHCNKHLLNHYLKYKDYLKFEILEIIENKNIHNILEREQYWIHYYDSYSKGYNQVKFAGHTTGFKMPEKFIKTRRTPILQYDLKGNFIKEWKSRTEIIENLGAFSSNKVLLKNSNYKSFNSLWFKKEDNFPLKVPAYCPLYKQKIIQYSKQGEFIKEWNSLLEAGNTLQIPIGNISKALKTKTGMAYNYIWKKWEKNYLLNIPIYTLKTGKQQYLKVTNLTLNSITIYKSSREVSLKLGLTRENFMKKLGKIIRKNKTKEKFIIELLN
jgi:hypothetical protein